MKITNLAIKALMVGAITSSLFGGESLSDALRNGTFKGELKAIAYDVDKAAKGEESIITIGVMLNYVSSDFYGFSIGLRGQSSNSPWADDAEKNFYKADLYGPGAVLEEAYVKYGYSKSYVKAGRQFIKTPLLSGSGARMIHESFEGYTLNVGDIKDTKIFAGYVDKYLTRTNFLDSTDISVGTFGKHIFMYGKKYAYKMGDGVWTIFAQNRSIKNLTLQGQYLVVKDAVVSSTGAAVGDISVSFLQAEYKFRLRDLKMKAGVQYGASDIDNDTSRSGDLVGFKLSTKCKKAVLDVGYTINSSDKAMVSGVGIASNWAYAGDLIGLENYNQDIDTLSLTLKYKPVPNSLLLARYTDYMAGSNATLNGGNDLNAYDLVAKYGFKGKFKGLGVKLMYENVDFDSGAIINYRMYLTYKF